MERLRGGSTASNKVLLRAPYYAYIKTMKLTQDIRSVTELKRNTKAILRQATETGRPVVLTMNGKANAVLIDAATFEKHLSAANMARLLAPAEEDVRSGRTRSMRQFMREFKGARKIRG